MQALPARSADGDRCIGSSLSNDTMQTERRSLLRRAAAGAAAAFIEPALPASTLRIKAVAFDAFPVFDPRPIFALAERLFPGQGAALAALWRTRQFEYAWLRTLMRRYTGFWQVTQEALVFAAETLKLELSAERRDQLMQAYLDIKAWPDALPALRRMRAAGLRMAFLSNFSAAMLDAGVTNSRLEGPFEPHLSTDRVGAYKPDPRAYQMAVEAFGLRREEILFVAFGAWDAAGAKAFGFPTFWVNRQHVRVEALGAAPDAVGADLADALGFVVA
jgi:2-haloacid dehalogenase